MALNYDPNKPVYPEGTQLQMPTLATPTATANTKTGASYIDPAKMTVAGQMKGLLADESDYMKGNIANAENAWAKRGLLNSSMAATAGVKAANDAALPIATTDAGINSQFAQNQQAAENTSALNTQAAQLDTTKASNTTQLAGALANQASMNQMKQTAFEHPMKKELLQMSLTSAEKQTIATIMGSQTNTMMGVIGSLLNNPDIEMGDNVSAWASDFMYSSWEGLGSLFNLDISVT